jgi:hypothetical protein
MRPDRQTNWNPTEHAVAQPAGFAVKRNVVDTVPTLKNVVVPLGRMEKFATWVWDVVGQFETASFTHVYVPRSETMSLYATVETDGFWSVKSNVEAETDTAPQSAAARAATCAATANLMRLRPRLKLLLPQCSSTLSG